MSDLVVVNFGLHAGAGEGDGGSPGLGLSADRWAEMGYEGFACEQAKTELRRAVDLGAQIFSRLGAVRIADTQGPDSREAWGAQFCWVMDRKFAAAVVHSWNANHPLGFVALVDSPLFQKIHVWADRPLVYPDPDDWPIRRLAAEFENKPLLEIFEALSIAPIDGEICSVTTPSRHPQPGETAEEWASRVMVDGQALIDAVNLFHAFGGDLRALLDLYPADEPSGLRWLVPSLILRGTVTEFVGPGGAGKSTLMTELCAAVGRRADEDVTFLGQKVNGGSRFCHFSGEDDKDLLGVRAQPFAYLRPEGYSLEAASKSIEDCVDIARRLNSVRPLDLVVIDPAASFLKDENDTAKVSHIFDQANALAAELDAAVIIVHHLRKNSVNRLVDVRPAIRGAAVFVDRPRMVFAILPKSGGRVEIGIVKHNIPPSEPLWSELNEGRLFQRNPITMRLDPIDSSPPEARRLQHQKGGGDAVLRRWILDTVGAHNAAGSEVRRTGGKGLYQGQRSTGGSYSRLAIERAQNSLVAAGLLLDTEAGLKICETPPVE